jgi:hypothetical protein
MGPSQIEWLQFVARSYLLVLSLHSLRSDQTWRGQCAALCPSKKRLVGGGRPFRDGRREGSALRGGHLPAVPRLRTGVARPAQTSLWTAGKSTFSQRGGGWESRSALRGQRRSCSSRRAAGQAPHVDASRGECVTPQPPRELALRRGSALSWMRWTTRAATDCGVTNSYAYATGDGAVQQRTRGGKAEAATPRSVSKRAGAQQVRLCAVSAIAFICSQARARP